MNIEIEVTEVQKEETVAVFSEPEPLPTFPKTRIECLFGLRPCPWLRCRDHVFWVKTNMNDRPNSKEPIRGADKIMSELTDERVLKIMDSFSESCTLDVIASGPHTLEGVGECLRVTRERVRQIQTKGLKKLEHVTRSKHLLDFWKDLNEKGTGDEVYSPGGEKGGRKRRP